MHKQITPPDSKVDILVVEDSDTQAEQLAELLLSHGYTVSIARNGREGLEQARSLHPLLVISDISMPEMDGFTMCRELRQDPALRDTPVILLTALTSLYDVLRSLDCGADNFIRKPIDGKYLLSRIRFILANRLVRKDGRVELGMQVSLGGQTHFVNAERQQIFDLLISTYEEAIHMTEELREQQNQITHSYQSLQGLYKIAEALNPALTEQTVAQQALQQALELPGVLGGCLMLLDDNGQLCVAAAENFGPADAQQDLCVDCSCRRKLLTNQLSQPEIVSDCGLLEAKGGSHVSIPLIVGDRTMGVMNLVGAGGGAFSPDDMQVLSTVGHQIAVALERARLYSRMEALVKQRTEALETERNFLSDVIRTAGALIVLSDPEGRIIAFNPAAEHSLGWNFEEVKGRHYWDVFFKPEDAEHCRQLFTRLKDEGTLPQTHYEWIARNGSVRHVIWSGSTLRRADQSVKFVMGSGIDITDLHAAEEKIKYLSSVDVVTGLPNRNLLRERAGMVKKSTEDGRHVMGLLMVQFTRLSKVREAFGAAVEQGLLQQAALRLQEGISREDMVGRYDDSNFAVIALRQDPEEIAALARLIIALLEKPFEGGEQEMHLEPAVGIALCPDDSQDFDTLSQFAEAAVRRALVSGAERYEFYTPELNRGAHERFRMENALRRALERNQLLLQYQPQLDLKSGKVIGMEALLRWRHPEFGLVPPSEFIPIAEETGLILPIGEWVLRSACEQVCTWQRDGVPVVPVAVNLSARQFTSNIQCTVRQVLASTGLSPSLLELELTESLSMQDPENTIGILRMLKDMGVQLSIDDFGTGYSNLNYLKRFPVDKLKLDQSFVRDLISDPDDLSISRAVVSMAKSLRLKVIAEGVETQGQLALLAYSGCDEMQGYLFSRPVDAQTAEKILREGRSIAPNQLRRRPCQRTLLVVENKSSRGAALTDVVKARGYHLHATGNISEAFEILATHEVGVVVCDQDVSGMPAAQFLSRVANMYPDTVRILTADQSPGEERETQGRTGLYRCFPKKCKDKELVGAIEGAFRQYQLGARDYARSANS